MEISLSAFKNIYDNKTYRRMDFADWNHFTKFLRGCSKTPLEKKSDAVLISPAVFVSDENEDQYPGSIKEPDEKNGNLEPFFHRKNRNVIKWVGWAALDVDNVEIEGDIHDYLHDFNGYRYVCYSTASSTREKPKFRLVFSLDRDVMAEEIRHFWYALNTEFGSIGDKQTKDYSRMYYIPGDYAGAYNFFYINPLGEPINVDQLLAKHPYTEKKGGSFISRLPEEVQKALIEHRRDQMNNNFSWTGYHDCPFINKQLIDEFKSIANHDGSGRYHTIYRIMVSIASNAIKRDYPITAEEIADMIHELDSETSRKYENRPLTVEADNAIEYAYRNV